MIDDANISGREIDGGWVCPQGGQMVKGLAGEGVVLSPALREMMESQGLNRIGREGFGVRSNIPAERSEGIFLTGTSVVPSRLPKATLNPTGGVL